MAMTEWRGSLTRSLLAEVPRGLTSESDRRLGLLLFIP